MKRIRQFLAAVALAWAVATPQLAAATTSVTPAVSYNGSYTVSWTDSVSGARHGYLSESVNGGAWADTRVTAANKAYTGKPVGAYAYKLKVFLYDAELRTEEFLYETNVATIQVTNSIPGVPGPILAPDSSATGAYSVSWGLAGGGVERYELYEGSALAQSGAGLTASFSAKPNGSYAYKVRACNAKGCSAFTGVRTVLVELSLTETVDVGDATPLADRTDIPAQGWVGSFPGTPSVDGGAALYRVAIELPPGRAGMQPSVGLSYSSRAGNGIAGVGWSLEAGGTIYRCPLTLEQDGRSRAVQLDDNDRLCFNGQRLLAATGGYGYQGTSYRTEVESFARITQMGANISSPLSYFVVEHKSGRSGLYAARPNTGTSTPSTWYLVSEQDRQGNCIAYEYAQMGLAGRPASDEEWVLSAIAYTGAGYAGTPVAGICNTGSDARRVEFEYTQDRKDKRTTYRAGAATVMTSRLSAVTTKVGSTVARRYELKHVESAATGRSLLKLVTVLAPSGADWVSLPPTTFAYQEDRPRFQFEALQPPGAPLNRKDWSRQVLGDFDGDGALDAVWGNAGAFYLESTADGAIAPLDTTIKSIPVGGMGFGPRADNTADLDGDGAADLLGAANGRLYVGHVRRKDSSNPALSVDWMDAGAIPAEACPPAGTYLRTDWSEGGTSTPVYATASNCADGKILLAIEDRDGDGRHDLRFHLPKHLAFRNTATTGLVLDTAPGHAATPPSQSVQFTGWFPALERDLNGDGSPDGYFEHGSDKPILAVSPGFPTAGGPQYPAAYLVDIGGPSGPFSKTQRWLDVNGDGLPDIFGADDAGQWHVWTNRGGAAGALPTFRQVNVTPTAEAALGMVSNRMALQMVMDIDGDGQDELLIPTTRVPGYEYCALGSAKDPDGVYYQWCGAQFDDIRLKPDISLDQSVFSWSAYKFQEQLDGSYVLVLVATDVLQAPANSKVQMKDTSGDGMLDLEFHLADDQLFINIGWYESLTDQGAYRSRNLANAPDLMTATTNGVGSSASWFHLPLSRGLATPGNHLPACTEALLQACAPCAEAPTYKVNPNVGDVSPGYSRFTSSMWVATRLDQDTGVSTPPFRTTCYRYEDAVLNTLGRGFQGFKKIISEERLQPTAGEPAPLGSSLSVNNIRVTTEFNQEFPFDNTVRHVTVERLVGLTEGSKIQESSQWWSALATAAGGQFVFQTAAEDKRFDLAGGTTPLSTTTSITESDPASGEAQRTCGFLTDAYGTTLSRDTASLTNDTTAWWLGRVDSKESVKDVLGSSWANLPVLASWPPTSISATTAPPVCPAGTPSTAARVVRKTFDWYPDSDGSRRRLRSEAILQPGSSLDEARTAYTYSSGLLLTKVLTGRAVLNGSGQPAQLLTTFGYGAGDYLAQTEQNPAGHVATTLHDLATGQPTLQQAIQGGPITETAYDPFGRPLKVTTTGTAPAYQRLAACGGAGCGSAVLVRSTIQAGAPTRTEYIDRLGRVVATRVTSFSNREVVSAKEFNARGKKVSEQAPRYVDDSAVFGTWYGNLDALGRVGRKWVTREALLFSHTSAKEPPAGDATQITDYEYAGLTTRIHAYKAGAGSSPIPNSSPALEMSRTYDSRGWLRETRQLLDRSAGPITTQYQYDPAGAVTQVGVVGSPPLVAEYDLLGRKTKVTDPDRGVWLFTWDGLGRLLLETDGRGAKVRQEYDTLGRTKERFATAAGTTTELHVASWEYDTCLIGALCREQGSAGGATEFDRLYKYDPLRRPYQVSATVKADDASQWRGTDATRTFVEEVGYDRRYGRVKARRLRTGSTGVGEAVVLDYDDRGNLLGETEWKVFERVRGTTYRQVTAMSPRGQVEKQVLGNGVVEDSTFDASTGLALNLQSKAGLTTVRYFDYRYDHFLNLTVQDRQINNQEKLERYGYDDLQRLVSARRCAGAACVATGAPADTETFSYDDLGNLTSKSDYAARYVYGTGIQAGAGPHAVVRVEDPVGSAATTFHYDGNGNMSSASGTGARTVDFDAENRAVRMCTSATGACTASYGTQTEFAYAPDGSRYREKVTGGDGTVGPRTVYSADKAYEFVAWSDQEEERFYLGPNVMVQTKRTQLGTSRAVKYLHLDRLGSVEAVTTDGGVEVSADSHGYDAWGGPRKGDWTSSAGRHHADDKVATTDRGFTGHEMLDGHGLIHMNGRVYDYRLGRFLTVDPIISNPANSQSINPYSYIGNNPLSGTDPTGYFSESVCRPGDHCTVNGEDGDVKNPYPGDGPGQATKSGGETGTPGSSAGTADTGSPGKTGGQDDNDSGGFWAKAKKLASFLYGLAKGTAPGGGLAPIPPVKDPEILEYIALGEAVGAGIQAGRASTEGAAGAGLVVAAPATDGASAIAGGGALTLAAVEAADAVAKIVEVKATLDRAKEMRGSGNGGGGDPPRVKNPSKGDSPIWRDAKPFRNGLKRSGEEIWSWDHTHNDIEVFNAQGRHLGSRHPVTGEMYKPPVPGRTLKL